LIYLLPFYEPDAHPSKTHASNHAGVSTIAAGV